MIATGPGPGGGPHVRIFNAKAEVLTQFFAYQEDFHGGVRVAFGNVREGSDLPEVVTAPASRGGPHIRLFRLDTTALSSFRAFEPWWTGSYDVTAGDGLLLVSSTDSGRRASVRILAPSDERSRLISVTRFSRG